MKILVRGTNWIGDAVMTIPSLKLLRRAFPDAEIVLQLRRAAADLFEDAEFVDEVYPIDEGKSAIGNVYRQTSYLRRMNFDLGVLFTNSFQSALILKLGGVPARFGYATEGRSFLLTEPVGVPEWKNERHEVFYYLNLVEAIQRKLQASEAVPDIDPEPSLMISEKRRSAARTLLAERGIDISKPTVALGVGSTNSRAKRWPAESYALLAKTINDELGANILLVGSSGDKEVAEDVLSRFSLNVVDMTGKTTVGEAAATLAEIDLLISNDMGLAHVAPAVGTKTIVIFGPTNEVTTRPFSKHAEVVRKDVKCSPCMLRDCPIDHRCMVQVTVEDIFSKAKTLLNLHDQ